MHIFDPKFCAVKDLEKIKLFQIHYSRLNSILLNKPNTDINGCVCNSSYSEEQIVNI